MQALQRESKLKQFTLHAADGDIGRLQEFYFNDETWVIRYLVVNTGSWLTGRRVLVVPAAVGGVRDEEQIIDVELTRQQIGESPPLESEQPVSRQFESDYYRYYGWPPYWETESLGGLTPPPLPPPRDAGEEQPAPAAALRSSGEVQGYHIEATDGAIGHVEDFIVDTQYWALRYLEVDTGKWWTGKKVLINPAWIKGISWARRVVRVDLDRDAIRSAPPYDPSRVISREYEAELFKYYGRAVYWK